MNQFSNTTKNLHEVKPKRVRNIHAHSPLWRLGYTTIKELETREGILASGKDEVYGCIFGRDSLITALKLLKAYEKTQRKYFLRLVKKILINLGSLQGKTQNIESGEQPGKCIHEYRPTKHEHLTQSPSSPWFLYPDNIMRNYDTVDATPLFLIATHEYARLSGDQSFIQAFLPNIRAAIDWIFLYGDQNGDGFIDYGFHPDRTFGGLRTQSWMDSTESVFSDTGEPVEYPIAPVEVQAYTYAALRAWGEYEEYFSADLRHAMNERADLLKTRFNEKFPVENNGEFALAFAIDGRGRKLGAARSSMGHVLWSARRHADGSMDNILNSDDVPRLVNRLLAPDLYVPTAGIRTLSSRSPHFDPNSYHNGSIWPHDTAMIADGLEKFGYRHEAEHISHALRAAYTHFNTPIELFVFMNGAHQEYRSPNGQAACRKQAWSAASLLSQFSDDKALHPELTANKLESQPLP